MMQPNAAAVYFAEHRWVKAEPSDFDVQNITATNVISVAWDLQKILCRRAIRSNSRSTNNSGQQSWPLQTNTEK